MSRIVVITAVGQDRPGIIARLAEVMYKLGANLEDATMTRLHGAFAAMLSARLPESMTEADVRAALAETARSLQLTVTVRAVADPAPAETEPDHVITVYGADRPGIVHRVTSELARLDINVTDMDTRMAGSSESPLYVMLLEVASGDAELTEDVAALRAELGVDISVQMLQPEAL